MQNYIRLISQRINSFINNQQNSSLHILYHHLPQHFPSFFIFSVCLYDPIFSLVWNLTQLPPFIKLSNSKLTSSSVYPEFITIVQNSIHSSIWIASSLFLSSWSKSSKELSFGKFLDQNLNVSSLSIVCELSVSINLNKVNALFFILSGS